jgi:hypothetical protein
MVIRTKVKLGPQHQGQKMSSMPSPSHFGLLARRFHADSSLIQALAANSARTVSVLLGFGRCVRSLTTRFRFTATPVSRPSRGA